MDTDKCLKNGITPTPGPLVEILSLVELELDCLTLWDLLGPALDNQVEWELEQEWDRQMEWELDQEWDHQVEWKLD